MEMKVEEWDYLSLLSLLSTWKYQAVRGIKKIWFQIILIAMYNRALNNSGLWVPHSCKEMCVGLLL